LVLGDLFPLFDIRLEVILNKHLIVLGPKQVVERLKLSFRLLQGDLEISVSALLKPLVGPSVD